MKKILTFFLTALLTFSVGWAETVEDVLNRAWTGITGSAYSTFSDKDAPESDAVYAGACAGGYSSIQFNSSRASGIVSTTSGGKVKSITVEWNTQTASGRTLDIYGKNTAYTAVGNLYGTTNQGTKLGSIVYGTSTALTITGDYEFIGVRPNSGAMYLTSITIEWETGSTTTLAPPTITPDGGEFLTSQQVTLSAENGASIYYTLDGNDPTTSSTLYEGAFTLTATTTVKAIAVKNGETSTVASATFTKTGVATLAEANALANDTHFTFTGNVVVTYSGTYNNNTYTWLRDLNGTRDVPAAGVFYNTGGELSQGDVLDPEWQATKITYNNWIEYTTASNINVSSSGTTVDPIDRTGVVLSDNNMNEYIAINNVKVTSEANGINYNAASADDETITYQLRNMFGVTLERDKIYNIEGTVGKYGSNIQVYPTKVTEVVTGDPTITLSPMSLTIDDSGTNNSFTVEARNLHENDNGNVSVAHNWVFNTTLTSGTNSIANWNGLQGFNRNYRSVDGTVTVNYEGRALTATDTYTVATEGASQTLTVTYVPSLYIVGNFGNAGWNYSADAATPMTNDGNGIYTATLDIPANSYILFSRKPGVTYNWENDGNRLYIGAVTDGGDFDASYSQSGTLDTNPYDDNPVKYHPIVFPEGGTYTITINATAGTFTITKQVVGADDFVLVTSTDDVDTTGEYVLVYTNPSNEDHAMSTAYSNNFYGQTTVGFSRDNNIVTLEDPTTVNVITLEDAGNGSFYIKAQGTDNDYYLYYDSGNTVHRSENYTAEDKYKWNITINDDKAIIRNVGTTDRYLQYNASSPRFACYTNSQQNAKLYKRGGSASISVPSTLDVVIPVGAASATENVTVTQNNVTGTTTISSVDGDASNFNVNLTGTTLSVTYNGTATQDSPEVITINLVNGEATASITVSGYKVPLTVTIRPIDGATFSHDSMDGTITANADDAVIYYKTNEMADFEVYNGSFTVTNNETEDPWVQAYAVCGSETSTTVTATYHHVSLSETLFTRVTSTDQLVADNKYIIVYDRETNPLALHNAGLAESVAWSDGNINIAGTSTTVFTLDVATDGYTLFCDNGYLTHNGRTTSYAENSNTLSIVPDADGDDVIGYYVMEGTYYLRFNTDVAESSDPFRWYNGTAGTQAYLFVQGVEEIQPTEATLAEIELNGQVNDVYTVSDQLIGVWAVNNGTVKYLWAKDQGQVSIDKRPAIDPKTEDNPDGQADYMVTHMKYQHYEFEGGYDWDESNWVILDFSTTSDDPFEYVGYKLQSMSVIGTYSDDNNYTIALDRGELPIKVSETQDAAEYPGWAGDDRGQHDSDNYGKKYRWAYNTYMPANFMPENLNREVDGQVVGFVSDNTALPNMQNQKLYFMNPKIMEVAHIWGVWCGNGSDKFSIYQVGMENGETVNAWNLHGAIDVLSWDYNHKEGSYGKPIGLDETAQDFHAVIVRKPGSKSLKAGVNNDPSSDEYGIYPLDMPDGGQPTAVRDLNADRQVESVRYYNVMGVESRQPFQGVNIIVTRFTDGTTTAVKVNK